MVTYWSLLSGATRREVEALERAWPTATLHPAEAKRDLAERLVALYHSVEAAAGSTGPVR